MYNEEVDPTRRQKLYKTQMCRHILATGACAHGMYCHFAHSQEELRPLAGWPGGDELYASPPVYPAELLGSEPSGSPQHIAQLRYKTRMCRHIARGGRCPKGNACGFAHSELELRRPGEATPLPRGPGALRGLQPLAVLPKNTNSSAHRRPRQAMYKTQLCRYAKMGAAAQCPQGDGCTFAHADNELRAAPRRHPPRPPTDCTARWKGAIFAARKNRAVLEALRDALVRQYRGRLLRSPPTSPPPIMSAFVTDQHDDDDEDPARCMLSAFESGILVDTTLTSDDDRPPLSPANEARESTQVRYLCLEIECCYSEELRRRADANAQARNWLVMAKYLAAAVDLVHAALQGVQPWHLALVTHPDDATPLPDFHDRRQLAAVLTVLTLVRKQTIGARDDAIAKCETVVDELRHADDFIDEQRSALAALDVLQHLTLDS